MSKSREKALLRALSLFDVLGHDGIDLLERLLDLNPSTRLTAD